MFKDLTGEAIKSLQFKFLTNKLCCKTLLSSYKHPAWNFILKNHQYNILLWHEEDLARRTNVPDNEIVTNKRNIDKYNQKRNDYIEQIDENIVQSIPTSHKFQKNTWINSETVGSIIDRMSINTLKCFNMEKQVNRKNIPTNIRISCKNKLTILHYQGTHLSMCLDNLLTGIQEGKANFKTYKQFKMYNDPNLNPHLAKSCQKHA